MMTTQPNGDNRIMALLTTRARWAMVGLSQNTQRPAFSVSQHVQDLGMEIIPVHPRADTVHGAKGYSGLDEIPGRIDVVDVFVAGHRVPALVTTAIRLQIKALWLQPGVDAPEAAAMARDAGLIVVTDTCPWVESRRLLR